MAGTRKYYKETVALAVNTSKETRDKLTRLANKKRVSRADLVNRIIEQYFDRERI